MSSSIQLNVNLNFQQLLETVKKLSPKEKMQINQVLWDDNMEIPIEHQELVLSRIKNARKNPTNLLDWDEVSKNM